MFKKIIIILLSLIPYCAFSADNSQDNKVVRIAITEYAPFEFKENGEVIGIDADAVKQSFAYSGYKVEFFMESWSRALMLAKSGDVDAVFSIRKNKEREEYFLFSDPIINTDIGFFKLKSLDISPKNLNDLKDYSVSIIKDYYYGEKFEQVKFSNLSIVTDENPEIASLKKLKNNRVQLVVCEVNVCNQLIKKYSDEFSGIDYIKTVLIDTYPYYIAFSKENMYRAKELVDIFNKGLKKYINDGEMKESIKKYDFHVLNSLAKE